MCALRPPPSLSIITACLNSVATLPQTLSSVASQVDIRVEHLIVDGGSTDGSLDVVLSCPHISRMVTEPDGNMYEAMNKGIDLAKGDIVGILNADDFYASTDVLKKVADVFKDHATDVCYGDLLYVDYVNTEKIVRYWRSGSCSIKKFYWGWMPPHPTFFVRKSAYERFGPFNLHMGSAADYELMLRLMVKHRLRATYIPEVLVKMRMGGVSNSSIKNRLHANWMDRRAWSINNLKPYPWTLYLKPLRKIGQWLLK